MAAKKKAGKPIADHNYGGKKFSCAGKHTKVKGKKTKQPRIFCKRKDAGKKK